MDQPIQFGPYLLLERISLGGMAEVFKAVEFGVEGFKRTVAVKRILPHVAEDDEFISMFKDEANIAVQLTHSNIAQIYKLGEEHDGFYIALEYVQGKDLRTIFERNRRSNEFLPVPQACFMVMQVCEGLDYAHNKKDAYGRALNIIHRDVSPPNVLVSFEGEVKLCDFGVAKAAGRVSKTQAGILKGKFGYMSPEQVKGQALDRRSDVFSLGVVFWEILTNQRLFQGEDDLATLKKLQAVEVPSPRSFNPQIPIELEKIVYKVLAAEPNDRYQSAAEFHDDLQAFMFAQGLFFSRKDLQAWMRRVYARDIELEKEKASKQQALMPGAAGAAAGDSGARRSTQIGMAAPPAPPGAPGRRPPPPPGGAGRAAPPAPPGKAQTAAYKAVGSPPTPPGASSAPPPAGGAADDGGRKRAKTMLMTGAKADIPVPGRPGAAPEPPRARAMTPPPPAPAAAPAAAGRGSDFDWDDEELETRIHDGAKPEDDDDDAATREAPRGATPLAAPVIAGASAAGGAAPTVGAAEAASTLRGVSPGRSIPTAPRPRAMTPPSAPAAVSMSGAPAPRAAGAPTVSMTSAAPPAVAAAPMPMMAHEPEPTRSNNTLVYAVLGLVAVVAIGVVAVFMMRPPATQPAADGTAAAGGTAPAAAATGGLSLDLTPADAKVEVDGNAVAGTGSPRVVGDLSAGSHKLVVSSGDAYLPYTQDLTVVAGAVAPLTVKLPLKDVTLDVTVEPAGAALALVEGDATDKAVAIQAKHTVSRVAGVEYKVQASLAGYKTQLVPVAFAGGATEAVKITLVSDGTAAGTGTTVATNTTPPTGTTTPVVPDAGGTKKVTSGKTSGGKSSGGGSSTKAKTAELKIGTAPGLPPAEVFIDGKSVGKTVVKVMVTPGNHTVKWKWADGASSSEKVSVGDGESKTLKGAK